MYALIENSQVTKVGELATLFPDTSAGRPEEVPYWAAGSRAAVCHSREAPYRAAPYWAAGSRAAPSLEGILEAAHTPEASRGEASRGEGIQAAARRIRLRRTAQTARLPARRPALRRPSRRQDLHSHS